MAGEKLVGTWMLVSLYGVSVQGETWQIYGENPAGMLTYTAEVKHGSQRS